ncbi:MAG: hypothetical protein E6R14_09020 [Thermomicrobiales bacterium]|nr:hypothetical protein [Fimbriimonadaceae bacterium]TXG80585.1 MAG: hypothetical protein E6R14_09020 [Thermomicrobiales bacterium]
MKKRPEKAIQTNIPPDSKGEPTTKERFALARAQVKRTLVPGFRDRLLSTVRQLTDVRGPEVDAAAIARYFALITGTAPATARRWLDESDPGLPDLASFSSLCRFTHADPSWLLGLGEAPLQNESEWMSLLTRDIAQTAGALSGVRVTGDEMEPEIKAGDWVLVDTTNRAWGQNGMFVIEYQGVRSLRTIDPKFGAGFVLSCKNKAYGETLIAGADDAAKIGLQLVGRAMAHIGFNRT